MDHSSDPPTFNPWAVVRHTQQLLADEGVKSTFALDDALSDADPLTSACRLLESLGVNPTLSGGKTR